MSEGLEYDRNNAQLLASYRLILGRRVAQVVELQRDVASLEQSLDLANDLIADLTRRAVEAERIAEFYILQDADTDARQGYLVDSHTDDNLPF